MERHDKTISFLIASAAFLSLSWANEESSVLTYLRPYRSVEVSTTERGEIREVFVTQGQDVSEGTPLLRLDSENIEARLAIAKAQAASTGALLAAEAEVKLNRERLQIVEKLQSRGTSNTAEYDRQKSLLEVSLAALTAAEEEKAIQQLQVESIEVELARRTLRSSIEGVVVEVARDAGEAINSVREDALVRIVEVEILKARAFIPVTIARDLKTGAEVKLATIAGDPLGVGTVEFVSPLSDPATNTVEIAVRFDNDNRNLPIGEPVSLVFAKGEG